MINLSVLGIELMQFRQSLRTCVCKKLFFFFFFFLVSRHQWPTSGSRGPSDVVSGIIPVPAGRDGGRDRLGCLLEESAEPQRRGLKSLEVGVSLGRVQKKAFASCFVK